MKTTLSFEMEINGEPVTVTGVYHPGFPATREDPPEGPEFDVTSIVDAAGAKMSLSEEKLESYWDEILLVASEEYGDWEAEDYNGY